MVEEAGLQKDSNAATSFQMMYKQGYFSKVNKNSRLMFIALSKEVKV